MVDIYVTASRLGKYPSVINRYRGEWLLIVVVVTTLLEATKQEPQTQTEKGTSTHILFLVWTYRARGYVTVLLLFSHQNFTNTTPHCLYLWVTHFLEDEKTICEKFIRKDLSKIDSGSKTRLVQGENLKKVGQSCNPSPSLPSVTIGNDKQSQGCNIVSSKQTE